MSRYPRPGDGYIDCGANVGTYALLVAHRIGRDGHLEAFEPFRLNCDRLLENAGLNGFSKITAYGFAVSDRGGVAQLSADWDVSNQLESIVPHRMPLPPAHLLVGVAAAECVRSNRTTAWKAGALGGLLAVLPDADSALGLSFSYAAPAHGLYTHTLVAAIAAGTSTWLVLGRGWGLVADTAWASHLILDLFSVGTTTHVYLLWPISGDPTAPIAPVFLKVAFEWQGASGLLPELHGQSAGHCVNKRL